MHGKGKMTQVDDPDINAIFENNQPVKIINYIDEELIFELMEQNLEESVQEYIVKKNYKV